MENSIWYLSLIFLQNLMSLSVEVYIWTLCEIYLTVSGHLPSVEDTFVKSPIRKSVFSLALKFPTLKSPFVTMPILKHYLSFSTWQSSIKWALIIKLYLINFFTIFQQIFFIFHLIYVRFNITFCIAFDGPFPSAISSTPIHNALSKLSIVPCAIFIEINSLQ